MHRINHYDAVNLITYAIRNKKHMVEVTVQQFQEALLRQEKLNDNMLFDQILKELQSKQNPSYDQFNDELTKAIIYVDFSALYTNNKFQTEINTDMFKSLFYNGITVTDKNGKIVYKSFEKSGGMSKKQVISFIHEDLLEPINQRIMMGIDTTLKFNISKLYAYKGLMLSDGVKFTSSKITFNEKTVVVINDVEIPSKTNITTAFNFNMIKDELITIYKKFREHRKAVRKRDKYASRILQEIKELSMKIYLMCLAFNEQEAEKELDIRVEGLREIIKSVFDQDLKSEQPRPAHVLAEEALHEIEVQLFTKLRTNQKEYWITIDLFDRVKTNVFDGAGIVSPKLVKEFNNSISPNTEKQHSSFQFRMPFAKGMLHHIDFKLFLQKHREENYIIDAFGIKREIKDIQIILTKSQFKCMKWLQNTLRERKPKEYEHIITTKTYKNGKEVIRESKTYDYAKYYFDHFNKYNHSLYIVNTDKLIDSTPGLTLTNYQFLSTLNISEHQMQKLFTKSNDLISKLRYDIDTQFDLLGVREQESFLVQVEEQDYSSEIDDYQPKRQEADDQILSIEARALMRNPYLLQTPYFKNKINTKINSIKQNASLGRLYVEGENRYLAPDMLFMLYQISYDKDQANQIPIKERLQSYQFHFPIKENGMQHQDKPYAISRNPHITPNEHVLGEMWAPIPNSERDYYCGHLTGVVMINPTSLISERLGGADYDGDMVKIIGESIYTEGIREYYKEGTYYPKDDNNIILIPNISALDVHISPQETIQTIHNTFSNKIGEYCNSAFHCVEAFQRSDEQRNSDENVRRKNASSLMVMMIGLEIDSAKTGKRPKFHKTKYKCNNNQSRKFVKYKNYIQTRNSKYSKSRDIKSKDYDSENSRISSLPKTAYSMKTTPNESHATIKKTRLPFFTFEERSNIIDTEITRQIYSITEAAKVFKATKRKKDLYTLQGKSRLKTINTILALYQYPNNEISSKELINFIQKSYDGYNVDVQSKDQFNNWYIYTKKEKIMLLEELFSLEDINNYKKYVDVLTSNKYSAYMLLPTILDLLLDIELDKVDINTIEFKAKKLQTDLYRVNANTDVYDLCLDYIQRYKLNILKDLRITECDKNCAKRIYKNIIKYLSNSFEGKDNHKVITLLNNEVNKISTIMKLDMINILNNYKYELFLESQGIKIDRVVNRSLVYKLHELDKIMTDQDEIDYNDNHLLKITRKNMNAYLHFMNKLHENLSGSNLTFYEEKQLIQQLVKEQLKQLFDTDEDMLYSLHKLANNTTIKWFTQNQLWNLFGDLLYEYLIAREVEVNYA